MTNSKNGKKTGYKDITPYPSKLFKLFFLPLLRGPSIAFAVDFQRTCLYCYFSAPGADGAVLGVEHTELAWGDALNFL